MYDTSGHQAETTAEQRKPPTLADIVREKTDDGRRIIDFFLDVMEARVEGAELCHRIDAAKQLVKYGSKDAARFIARYRGVSCGHSTRGRRDPADPCSGAENAPAAATLDASSPLTQDFLTVLSAVDEDLMARLVRAQTVDGGTIIDFLDDVMQDRNDGFRPHHRIAAAKELIVHIVRDEAPEPVPGEAPTSANPEPNSIVVPAAGSTIVPADNSIVVPATAGTHPLNPEPVLSTVEGPAPVHPEPAEGARPECTEGPVLSTVEGPLTSVHPEPGSPEPVERVEGARPEFTEGPADNSSVVPAKEPAEGSQDTVRPPRRRRTRKQRRQHGAARAAILGKHHNSEHNNKEGQDKPAPVELTIAERRIKERLEQHWHEPDPYGAPIDSTHPGRSPPW